MRIGMGQEVIAILRRSQKCRFNWTYIIIQRKLLVVEAFLRNTVFGTFVTDLEGANG